MKSRPNVVVHHLCTLGESDPIDWDYFWQTWSAFLSLLLRVHSIRHNDEVDQAKAWELNKMKQCLCTPICKRKRVNLRCVLTFFAHGREFDVAPHPFIGTPLAKMTMHCQNMLAYCILYTYFFVVANWVRFLAIRPFCLQINSTCENKAFFCDCVVSE